jgi:DNA polymerase-1
MTPIIPPADALWVIDGHSQIFRAYYAIRPLSTLSGQATNAIFGFLQILGKLRRDYSPQYLAVALDRERSFRNDLYAEYKANRSETPAELISQCPYVEKILEAMNIPTLASDQHEADDFIASLARRCRESGTPMVIVSADKDLFQLVGDGIYFLRLVPGGTNAERMFDPAGVEEEMGVPPRKMVDYQALVGDSTDNIPGVPGIGPKTAIKLLAMGESLEDLLAHPEKIDNKRWRGLVVDNAEKARMAWKLAKLDDAAPVPFEVPASFAIREPQRDKLAELYRQLEFVGHLKELQASAPASDQPAKPAVEISYRIAATAAELEEVARLVREAGRFAFDTETTGIEALGAEMVGLSVGWKAGQAAYVPIGHKGFAAAERPQATLEEAQRILGPLFADAALPKVAHHAKYDIKILERHGFKVEGLAGDTMIAAFLIDSDRPSLGLKQLAQSLLNMPMQPIEELIGKGRGQITMAEVSIDQAAPYASADADATFRLDELLAKSLRDLKLEKLYREMEMPLVGVLDRMERRGIALDRPYMEKLQGEFRERVGKLRERVWKEAGTEFNLNSPKQVAEVLFAQLGLKPTKKTKSGPSTDASVLEELRDQHPAVEALLEYRQLEKLNSGYVEQLPKLINPETGRIHASFSQTVASTGRLACHDPNLQNIPIRSEEGRMIRRAFIPSAPDRLLLAADYSQIELRLLAHIAEDEALLGAFARGEDVHRLTASKVFGVPLAEVTSAQRSAGKTINFGVIYGIGAFRLAQSLKIERSEAAKFIDDYFAGYPGISSWIEKTRKFARERGYTETMLGRRRRCPEIDSPQTVRRQAAERAAINSPIQGSAADLIKLAMIELDRRLLQEMPDCLLLLQVHDELVLDCPADQVEAAGALTREVMENAYPLSAPLVADVKTGRNWNECK